MLKLMYRNINLSLLNINIINIFKFTNIYVELS